MRMRSAEFWLRLLVFWMIAAALTPARFRESAKDEAPYFSTVDSAYAGAADINDEGLAKKIADTQAYYQTKYKSAAEEVNKTFGIDFYAMKAEFDATMNQYGMKQSLIDKIEDPIEKNLKMKELEQEYQDPRLYQYIEAYYYFENEVEKDHEFVGELLTRLENILELATQKDACFRYLFNSPEFRKEFGLCVKRVVWGGNTSLQSVSAETTPLNVHSVFGDKTKLPILIKFTPLAFTSLPFLRSIMIHELNHVCFYKDPQFSDVTKFSGGATQKAEGEHTHYFKTLNPFNPTYQYHLIHEYYSFKTQLIFNKRVPDSPLFKLDDANLKNTQGMLDWSYSQLSDSNKQFVKEHPDPPIMRWLDQFYGKKA